MPSLSEFERLFLLEFFVDYVTIQNASFDLSASTLCVSFQFLHYPVMRVCEQSFTPKPNLVLTEDSKVIFKRGKSCLFSIHSDENNKVSSRFNLIIAVCQQTKESKQRYLIGQAAVDLGDSFLNLLQATANSTLEPKDGEKYDLFPLKDKFRRTVGTVAAFARLSHFGKIIITQFQLAAEDNMNYMFKGTDAKRLFKDDPMMNFPIIEKETKQLETLKSSRAPYFNNDRPDRRYAGPDLSTNSDDDASMSCKGSSNSLVTTPRNKCAPGWYPEAEPRSAKHDINKNGDENYVKKKSKPVDPAKLSRASDRSNSDKFHRSNKPSYDKHCYPLDNGQHLSKRRSNRSDTSFDIPQSNINDLQFRRPYPEKMKEPYYDIGIPSSSSSRSSSTYRSSTTSRSSTSVIYTSSSSTFDRYPMQRSARSAKHGFVDKNEDENYKEIEAEINGHSITVRVVKNRKNEKIKMEPLRCCPLPEPPFCPNAPNLMVCDCDYPLPPELMPPRCQPQCCLIGSAENTAQLTNQFPQQNRVTPTGTKSTSEIQSPLNLASVTTSQEQLNLNTSLPVCPREDCPLGLYSPSPPTDPLDLDAGCVALRGDQVFFQMTNRPAGEPVSEKEKKVASSVYYTVGATEGGTETMRHFVQITPQGPTETLCDGKGIDGPVSGIPLDNKQDMFLLKVLQQNYSESAQCRLEMELRTPKDKEPKPESTTVDTQCFVTDFPPVEKKNKKGKIGDKKGKKGKK